MPSIFKLFVIFFLSVIASPHAWAGDLFYDGCLREQAFSDFTGGAKFVMVASYSGPKLMGLTCEDLKGFKESAQVIEMALYPATLAVTMTPARDIISSELAALGLTMANPAVLSVMVAGAFGVVTIYFILKKSMDECEQMERENLKRAIFKEVELRYGIQPKNIPLQMKK